ncbi:uncharacterized protein LOC110099951 [Dendrobium catenatum]|uniref:Uncharacterized protein n=1 Tax=Dendrobium catenatum TaxID=906689 RepID=A0A2I0X4Q1_9ASPA|nr:uncharacterized protein LOC110099951 [Dendrobium catenatum]PKU82882.1 hypothetical protein MA16_Dca006180 [Dendrobium catenatum]
MGFFSFAGRVLFASIFLLSAYQEFNEYVMDGGPAAQTFRSKYNIFIRHVTTTLGMEVPKDAVKYIVSAHIVLKGIGGLLFIFNSSFGAYLLLFHLAWTAPIIYDFYNYDIEKPEFAQLFVNFTLNLALFGALLFYLGMKNSILKRQGKRRSTRPKTH